MAVALFIHKHNVIPVQIILLDQPEMRIEQSGALVKQLPPTSEIRLRIPA